MLYGMAFSHTWQVHTPSTTPWTTKLLSTPGWFGWPRLHLWHLGEEMVSGYVLQDGE